MSLLDVWQALRRLFRRAEPAPFPVSVTGFPIWPAPVVLSSTAEASDPLLGPQGAELLQALAARHDNELTAEIKEGALVVTVPDAGLAGPADVEELQLRVREIAALVRPRVDKLDGPPLVCPTCDDTSGHSGRVYLAPKQGRLLEAVCPSCRGHFVDADTARERVFEPRGLSPADVEAQASSRGVARCARCAAPMTPVLIDGEIVDVCRRCGALWCDEGELSRLVLGTA